MSKQIKFSLSVEQKSSFFEEHAQKTVYTRKLNYNKKFSLFKIDEEKLIVIT